MKAPGEGGDAVGALHSLLGSPTHAPRPIGAVYTTSVSKAETTEATLNMKTRSWEQANHVLGHSARSSLRRYVCECVCEWKCVSVCMCV